MVDIDPEYRNFNDAELCLSFRPVTAELRLTDNLVREIRYIVAQSLHQWGFGNFTEIDDHFINSEIQPVTDLYVPAENLLYISYNWPSINSHLLAVFISEIFPNIRHSLIEHQVTVVCRILIQ